MTIYEWRYLKYEETIFEDVRCKIIDIQCKLNDIITYIEDKKLKKKMMRI